MVKVKVTSKLPEFAEGDVISDDMGCCERKILGKLNDCYALSEVDDFDTFDYLEDDLRAYKFMYKDEEEEDDDEDDEDENTVTMQEIADAFWIPVEDLKIVKGDEDE